MKNAEDYLGLPYHFVLLPDVWDDGTPGWFVKVEELDGCMAQGHSPDEAIARIRDAMLAWLDAEIAEGHEIPLPRDDSTYSGRFLARLPESLHRQLAEEARREGVSLNQFITAALAGAVGWRAKPTPAQRRRVS